MKGGVCLYYDFETLADNRNMGNLKDILTPDAIKEAGIVSFFAAEMDYKTAPSVIREVTAFAENGLYAFTASTQIFRDAIKWWMRTTRSWEIEDDWIVPTLGTIFSVATAIRMTTNEGDGIIVQSPVYYRYEQAATRMNRKTVHNQLRVVNGTYQMDFEDLEEKMQDTTNKLLVLCNPHNPIGRVWPQENLLRVAELAAKYNVVVVSDEIFAEYTFGNHSVTPYSSLTQAAPLGITLTSLGKSFNFTGVNYATAIIPDEELRERFIQQKYYDHFGSIDPFAHAAIKGAYCPEGLDWLRAASSYMEENIRFAEEFLPHYVPQVKMFPVEGSYVAWFDFSAMGLQDEALLQFLENECQISPDPGTEFNPGGSSFARLNLATTHEQFQNAMRRLAAGVEKYLTTEKQERKERGICC